MHPTILVKRKAEAVAKLISSSEALAETLKLDSELINGLHPVGTHDNQLREMLLLEGAANLITAVAIEVGANVTVVTPPASDEDLVALIPVAMGPDGLPAPTLDEALTAEPPVEATEVESKPKQKKTKGRKRP